ITLNDSAPKIWRRILVPANYTFFALHCAVQNAMGWSDGHLQAFYIGEKKGRERITIEFPNPEADDFYRGDTRDERQEPIADYMQVTEELVHQMLSVAGRTASRADTSRQIKRAINNGDALKVFKEMLYRQGVKRSVADDLPSYLPQPKDVWTALAPRSGCIGFVDARCVAESTRHLGVLRLGQRNKVDLTAGVWLLKKRGEDVVKGEPLAQLHSSTADIEDFRAAADILLDAYSISQARPSKVTMIKGIYG
ncbi:MAG: hypothetical protein AABZ44_00315, partial [Elusimicrobiota bacterium]